MLICQSEQKMIVHVVVQFRNGYPKCTGGWQPESRITGQHWKKSNRSPRSRNKRGRPKSPSLNSNKSH